jgi:hypothetical protein
MAMDLHILSLVREVMLLILPLSLDEQNLVEDVEPLVWELLMDEI